MSRGGKAQSEPTSQEAAPAARRSLDLVMNAGGPVWLSTHSGSIGGDDVQLPPPALVALAEVLDILAEGEGVTVLPARAELTTQQAANALNVSRPYLIGLLDAGQIEYRTVGRHRRIRAASLARYLDEDDRRRKAAADALASEAHELGMA